MSHPRAVWIVFLSSLAIVIAAMGWASHTVVRLDRAQQEARRLAARQELVGLALWRMDAGLTAIVAQESARPYFHYQPFHSITDAFTPGLKRVGERGVLIPSPLLNPNLPLVKLHFHVDADGRIASPQVPAGEMRKLATPEYVSEEALEQAASRLEELKAFLARDLLLAALPEARTSPVAMGKDVPLVAADPAGSNPEQRQRLDQEFYARQVTQMNNTVGMQNAGFNQFQNSLLVQYGTMREGEARGVWIGPNLLLARRVLVGGQTHVVGAWWDWGEIQNWLLKNVADLLPAARLEAAGIDAAAEQPHRLATLPVRLVPGAVPVETPPGPSATIVSLAGAWVGLLLAAGAVGGLLHGTLSLSERRGAFVSAVTHELRTPLTTMRMYAEMLADGMVTDEQKRIRYLATVREETNRLCRLVENVLSYSRLEGNRRQVAPQPVDLAQLLQEVEPRLRRRASEAGMELVLGDAAAGGSATVTTDPAALEQILLNLVDNACKYAARAEDRRIHLELLREGRSAVLRVRDHGPGVPAGDRERIFRPFFRAKRDSAGSFGGVGLGLAISRRLARSLGGEIRVDRSAGRGAGFSLILPGT